jgi:hypothetical protein
MIMRTQRTRWQGSLFNRVDAEARRGFFDLRFLIYELRFAQKSEGKFSSDEVSQE